MATIRDLVGGTVDFGRHSHDYAAERPGPPDTFYDRLDRLRPLLAERYPEPMLVPHRVFCVVAEKAS